MGSAELYTEKEDLAKLVKELNKSNVQKENEMLKNEVTLLTHENSKLKDMVREAEARSSPQTPGKTAPAAQSKDDNLSKLTKEFLDELSSLEVRERKAAASTAAANVVAPSSAAVKKGPTVNVQADV